MTATEEEIKDESKYLSNQKNYSFLKTLVLSSAGIGYWHVYSCNQLLK